jgi:hypothetical protein
LAAVVERLIGQQLSLIHTQVVLVVVDLLLKVKEILELLELLAKVMQAVTVVLEVALNTTLAVEAVQEQQVLRRQIQVQVEREVLELNLQ